MFSFPVTFTFQNIEYSGELVKVPGVPSLTFDLEFKRGYWGMVIWNLSINDFIFFGNPKNDHLWTEEEKDYLIRVVYAAGEDDPKYSF